MPSQPRNPTPDAFRLIAPDSFAGAIGGVGQVIGSAGRHDITVIGRPGRITFDPSFNGGGDMIRLPGDAGEWLARLTGSSASLRLPADALRVVVPVGMAGASLAFADGVRILRYDEGEQAVKLGEQTLIAEPATVAALPDSPTPAAQARQGPVAQVFILSGSTISLDGAFSVTGRWDGPDSIEIGGGTVALDPAFGNGGNELRIHGTANQFTATFAGSELRLVGPKIDLTMPVGFVANALVFDIADQFGETSLTGEDTREIGVSGEPGEVMLSGQKIGATPQRLVPSSHVASED